MKKSTMKTNPSGVSSTTGVPRGGKGKRLSISNVLRGEPGKQRSFLETVQFAQGVKVRIPVLTVTGSSSGPLVVIMSSQHGREINGIAAIERGFNALQPEAVSGTVVFLPVMNPLGVRMQQQDFPSETSRYRRTGITQTFNMNRTWPDAEAAGSTYAAAVTSVVWNTYVKHADFLLDFHGWSGHSLSLAWAHQRHVKLLRNFGFPWHLVKENEPAKNGMSGRAGFIVGIPTIIAELAPQNIVDNSTVDIAVRSMTNLLKESGVIKGKPELPPVQFEFAQSHVETAMVTPAEGLLVCDFMKGDWVRKGQTVARVLSLETLETLWSYQATHDALVYNIGAGLGWGEDHLTSAVVYTGQTVGLLKKPTQIIRNRR